MCILKSTRIADCMAHYLWLLLWILYANHNLQIVGFLSGGTPVDKPGKFACSSYFAMGTMSRDTCQGHPSI